VTVRSSQKSKSYATGVKRQKRDRSGGRGVRAHGFFTLRDSPGSDECRSVPEDIRQWIGSVGPLRSWSGRHIAGQSLGVSRYPLISHRPMTVPSGSRTLA
jgi:hypothetical protein